MCMKKRVATLALMITAQAFAWQPIFQEHETINIGGTEFKDLPINLYGDGKFRGYPAINFTDFNGDGLNDLVVALFDKGAIAVAENVGTQTEPQFDEYRFLTNESRDTSFANPI